MKEIPWFNRPWTKLKRKGVASLDDAELLSMILMRGNKHENCLELSNKLLARFNLHQFHTRSIQELSKILGEDTKAYQILALSELFKRYSRLKSKGFKPVIESARDIYHHFKEDLKGKKKEHLYAVLLDVRQRIIKTELISVGTLNQSFAHPREVFSKAIKEAAHAIIVVHNHPSGEAKPSPGDIATTRKLIRAGKVLGIKVLDHVIISPRGYWSWQENK